MVKEHKCHTSHVSSGGGGGGGALICYVNTENACSSSSIILRNTKNDGGKHVMHSACNAFSMYVKPLTEMKSACVLYCQQSMPN